MVTSKSVLFSDSQSLWYACRFCSKECIEERQKESKYEEDIRSKILEASLTFVPEVGWSKEAISKGAQTVGYPGVAHGMFTRGGADLVHYFQTSSNLKLVEILKKVSKILLRGVLFMYRD